MGREGKGGRGVYCAEVIGGGASNDHKPTKLCWMGLDGFSVLMNKQLKQKQIKQNKTKQKTKQSKTNKQKEEEGKGA